MYLYHHGFLLFLYQNLKLISNIYFCEIKVLVTVRKLRSRKQGTRDNRRSKRKKTKTHVTMDERDEMIKKRLSRGGRRKKGNQWVASYFFSVRYRTSGRHSNHNNIVLLIEQGIVRHLSFTMRLMFDLEQNARTKIKQMQLLSWLGSVSLA